MTALTLVEFLLARITEDEGSARDNGWLALEYGVDSWGRERFSARVLAECEAKRRIVEEHRGGAWPHPGDPCDAHDGSGRTIPCDTLRFLALPYADHPDYREEWRP